MWCKQFVLIMYEFTDLEIPILCFVDLRFAELKGLYIYSEYDILSFALTSRMSSFYHAVLSVKCLILGFNEVNIMLSFTKRNLILELGFSKIVINTFLISSQLSNTSEASKKIQRPLVSISHDLYTFLTIKHSKDIIFTFTKVKIIVSDNLYSF